MAGLLNPAVPERFEPSGQDEVPPGRRVAYLIRPPTVYDRAAYDRAVTARGAVSHSEAAMLDCLAEGVQVLLGGKADKDLRAAYLGRIDGYRNRLIEAVASADRDELYRLMLTGDEPVREIADIVRRGHARYAGMEADREYHTSVAAIEAARMFVTGWENLAADCLSDAGGLTEASLTAIPAAHLTPIRFFVLGLSAPDRDEAKNSDSPSPGSSTGKSSTSAARAKPTPRKARCRTTRGRSPKSASTD